MSRVTQVSRAEGRRSVLITAPTKTTLWPANTLALTSQQERLRQNKDDQVLGRTIIRPDFISFLYVGL